MNVHPVWGLLLGLLAALSVGLGDFVYKLKAAPHCGPRQIPSGTIIFLIAPIEVCLALGALVLLLFLPHAARAAPNLVNIHSMGSVAWLLAVLAGVLVGIAFISYYHALDVPGAPLSELSPLSATFPVVTLLLTAEFVAVWPDRWLYVALATILLGTGLVAYNSRGSDRDSTSTRGLRYAWKLTLIASIAWGVAYFLINKCILTLGWYLPYFLVTIGYLLTSSVYYVVLRFGRKTAPNRQAQIGGLASPRKLRANYQILLLPAMVIAVCEVVGNLTYSIGGFLGTVSFLAPVFGLYPVFSIALANLHPRMRLTERLGIRQYLGVALLLCGLTFVALTV
jgi:drug/metabolite transporter (DMT)-like permease